MKEINIYKNRKIDLLSEKLLLLPFYFIDMKFIQ